MRLKPQKHAGHRAAIGNRAHYPAQAAYAAKSPELDQSVRHNQVHFGVSGSLAAANASAGPTLVRSDLHSAGPCREVKLDG